MVLQRRLASTSESRARAAGDDPAFGRRDLPWAYWPDDRIWSMPLAALRLDIHRSRLAPNLDRVSQELAAVGLRVRPHFWFSDAWACPVGVTGASAPFFLGHDRLRAMSRRACGEAEGESVREQRMLLRHELGHVVQFAFGLHRRRKWQRVFGINGAPYPRSYRPRPDDRRFVRHLEGWYAQAHPTEDFAETFAVWLTPRSNWRRRYADWEALEKLEYVDELMADLAGRRPEVVDRSRPFSIATLRTSVGECFDARRAAIRGLHARQLDADLRACFAGAASNQRSPRIARRDAVSFVGRHRHTMIAYAVETHGIDPYRFEYAWKTVCRRCAVLGLPYPSCPETAVARLARIVLEFANKCARSRLPSIPM